MRLYIFNHINNKNYCLCVMFILLHCCSKTVLQYVSQRRWSRDIKMFGEYAY